MRYLVPHRIFDHLLQLRFRVCQPLVRTLEYRDPIRHREALEDATLWQRTPLVQAQQSPARSHSGFRQFAGDGSASTNIATFCSRFRNWEGIRP